MTTFVKELFEWDGMYLMYKGEHNKSVYYIANPYTHPSRVGTPQSTFIARFKWGSKPWKSWINFLVKSNVDVERYVELSEQTSPLEAMDILGYKGAGSKYKTMLKMKEQGII